MSSAPAVVPTATDLLLQWLHVNDRDHATFAIRAGQTLARILACVDIAADGSAANGEQIVLTIILEWPICSTQARELVVWEQARRAALPQKKAR